MEFKTEIPLSNESIDLIAEKTTEFLDDIKLERKNILRIRLLVEELLLDWQEKFSEDTPCSVKMGRRWGKHYIALEVPGEAYNPLEKTREEYGSYRERLLANMGLAPMYTYGHGKNQMVFKFRKRTNPLVKLAIALVAAVAVGMLGMCLPDQIRETLLNSVLLPVYDTFFNLLGTIAGPMVFLSVAWGIYGIGDTATFGKIGKHATAVRGIRYRRCRGV